MRASTKNKLGSVTTLVVVLGSLFSLIYISSRAVPSGANKTVPSFSRFSNLQPTPNRAPIKVKSYGSQTKFDLPTKKNVVLSRHRKVKIGNTIMTYRGLDGGSKFKLDVTVLDLDPEYVYSRSIEISQARNGFNVGGKSFVLLYARRWKMSVQRDG